MRYRLSQLEKLNKALVNELKDLVNELREEESIAKSLGNDLHYNGLCQARVMLESRLEKHGISRNSTIDNAFHIKVNCEQANNKDEENLPQKTDHQSPLANALLSKANNISANAAPSDEVAISTQIGKPRFTI